MKLVYWPLMGGLLHLVQRGGDWAGPQPGLPWGLNFNAHTHPIPTVKPVGIPTESPYPQNPEIIHTRTLHAVYFCLMHISCYFLSCMPSVCIIIVCTQYCTAWCMDIIIQHVQIKLSLTDPWGFIIVPIPIPHPYPRESPWESPYPRQPWPQPAQAPPRCIKCNRPPINGQCINHRCTAVLINIFIHQTTGRNSKQ